MAEHPQDSDPPWVDLTWVIAERKCLHDIMPDEPLHEFAGYEAIKTFEGGMGLVVVARDPDLERMVALKLCKSSGPEAMLAMLAEAQTLAKLSHPNVVTVHGVGESELGLYFVMEYVDGLDGERWLIDQPRSRTQILAVFLAAGEGLVAAHEAGIQHGDFKPKNVLIGKDGRVRVADFGVAALDGLFGGVGGTPEYMAPERLREQRGDARSDQFSFCVGLYRALYDDLPFDGRDRGELLAAIEAGSICFEAPMVPVPIGLEQLLRKGLAGNPDERFPSMRALLDALSDWADDDEIDDVTQLLRDLPIAAWGAPIERRAIGLQVEDKLLMSTGLSEEQLAAFLDREPRRYLLIARLSDTRHATVYAALDALLNRDVVVKIHRDLRVHAMQLALHESQVLANVVHPNVVQIYDIGESGGWLFAVLEPCEIDLHRWCRVRSRTWREVLPLVLDIGHGLAHLHELGYAHGDVKPGNALIFEGRAKLSDFGHVTIAGTGEGGHGGTVGYVAPDVYRNGPSERGDLFALGITIFELLLGYKPYGDAKTIEEGVRLVEAGELRLPETLPEGLPKSVLPLIVRAIDPDPDKRPTLDEFLAGLRSALDQRERRRRRAAVSGAAAAVLVVGALSGAVVWSLLASHGDGSLADAAWRAIGPLTRAEMALGQGDIDGAVDEVFKAYEQVERLSEDEILTLADGVKRFAQELENSGYCTDALDVWHVVFRLYVRGGDLQKAAAARATTDRERGLCQSK